MQSLNAQRGGYIREKKVLELLPVHRSTLWRWVSNGSFPKPKKLTAGVTVWPTAEVVFWLESKLVEDK